MKREIIPYNPRLRAIARKLRNNSTLSEILLWKYLKNKQLNGYDFDRQKPIDEYIVDFYCKDLRLAIEIDGVTHGDKVELDRERQDRLEGLGLRILRFSDSQVKKDIDSVLRAISWWIEDNAKI